MAGQKLTEKTVTTTLKDEAHVVITQKETVSGAEVESVRRIPVTDFAEKTQSELKQDLTNEQTYSAQLDIWIKRYEKYTDIVQPYNKVVAFIPVLNPKAKIHLILDDIELAGDYLLVQTSKERTTDSSKIVTTKYKYNKLKQEYVFDALTNDEKYIVISSGTAGKNVVFSIVAYNEITTSPKDEMIYSHPSESVFCAQWINANNVRHRFEFEGICSFWNNGSIVRFPNTIPYSWFVDVGTQQTRNLVYTQNGEYLFKTEGNVLRTDTVLFSFLCEGQSQNGNAFVRKFTHSPIDCKVDGSYEGYHKAYAMDRNDGVYYGEKVDLEKHYYESTNMFTGEDFGSVAHATNAQGFDIYADKYLFQICAESDDSYIQIYDIELGSKVAEIALSDKTIHGNVLNCGEKDASKKYPVLYISRSSSSTSGNGCAVIQISDDANTYTLLQEFSVTNAPYIPQIDYVVDAVDKKIYTIVKYDSAAPSIVKMFDLPNVTSGNAVLDWLSPVASFEVPIRLNQGGTVIGDKIYFPVGLGTTAYPTGIHICDKRTLKILTQIPMEWAGEIEGVALYKNKMVINFAGKPVYRTMYFG